MTVIDESLGGHTLTSSKAQVPAQPFWTKAADENCAGLRYRRAGLTVHQARDARQRFGPNANTSSKRTTLAQAVLRRLLEPLSLILMVSGAVSAETGDGVDGGIIFTILALSIGLDTVHEGQAVRASQALRRSVALKAEIKRDGAYISVPVEDVVPGDVVSVRAGDIIPADALVLESDAFTANEVALTGEPYPVEKRLRAVKCLAAGDATNTLFRGAVGQTGETIALVTGTGRQTLFGAAAASLAEAEQGLPFQREPMASQIRVIFIIRTNGRPWKDLPRPVWAASSLSALFIAMVLPFTPAGAWFGFVAPPLAIIGGLLLTGAAYLICAELMKRLAIGQLTATGLKSRPLSVEPAQIAIDADARLEGP